MRIFGKLFFKILLVKKRKLLISPLKITVPLFSNNKFNIWQMTSWKAKQAINLDETKEMANR